MKHQTELTDILNSNKFKNCELKPWSAPTKSFLSIPFYGTPCRPTVSTCRYWNMYSKNFLPELLSYLFNGHKMFRSCFRAGMKKFSGTTLFESILSLFNTSQLHFATETWNWHFLMSYHYTWVTILLQDLVLWSYPDVSNRKQSRVSQSIRVKQFKNLPGPSGCAN